MGWKVCSAVTDGSLRGKGSSGGFPRGLGICVTVVERAQVEGVGALGECSE